MFKKQNRKSSRAPDLAQIIHRNIDAIASVRKKYEASKSPQDKISDSIAAFFGSFKFLQFQLLFCALWIAINSFRRTTALDAYPFPLLALITSVSALFMAGIVLIRQNRLARINSRHADLDLQISLFSEHEITRLIHMVEAVIKHTGTPYHDPGLAELKNEVEATALIEKLENTEFDSD